MVIPDKLIPLVQRLAAQEFLERNHAFHLAHEQMPGSATAQIAKGHLDTARELHQLLNGQKAAA